MPLEIDEIAIRLQVGSPSSEGDQGTVFDDAEDELPRESRQLREQIVSDCVRQVLEVLREREGR